MNVKQAITAIENDELFSYWQDGNRWNLFKCNNHYRVLCLNPNNLCTAGYHFNQAGEALAQASTIAPLSEWENCGPAATP